MKYFQILDYVILMMKYFQILDYVILHEVFFNNLHFNTSEILFSDIDYISFILIILVL